MNDATMEPKENTTSEKVELLDLPVEEVEIRKLNRHERRKQAKLARMLAVKERLEMQKRQKPKVESEKENKNG